MPPARSLPGGLRFARPMHTMPRETEPSGPEAKASGSPPGRTFVSYKAGVILFLPREENIPCPPRHPANTTRHKTILEKNMKSP